MAEINILERFEKIKPYRHFDFRKVLPFLTKNVKSYNEYPNYTTKRLIIEIKEEGSYEDYEKYVIIVGWLDDNLEKVML